MVWYRYISKFVISSLLGKSAYFRPKFTVNKIIQGKPEFEPNLIGLEMGQPSIVGGISSVHFIGFDFLTISSIYYQF
jgi:hypothetical protein